MAGRGYSVKYAPLSYTNFTGQGERRTGRDRSQRSGVSDQKGKGDRGKSPSEILLRRAAEQHFKG